MGTSSLSSQAEIATTTIVSPNFPSSSTKRTLNNKQDAVTASDGDALPNEKEGDKENSFKVAKKKKHSALSGNDAGAMLYSALHTDDPHVQSLCSILADCCRFEAAAEERHQLAEQAAVMEHNKLTEHQVQVEERAQHMKLLEMLHDGKISEEMYRLMKPNGF